MAIVERTRVPILAAAVLLSSVSGQPLCAATAPLSASDFHADANVLAGLIQSNYAYLDELPGGIVPTSPQLNDERDAVHDADSLLRYAEDMITALADHHALTGKSFGDDWAIVPSYADLWITRSGSAYVVEAVKEGSIADRAGIRPGFTLSMVDRQPIDQAVAAFWSRIGLQPTAERQAYAALVMAAGRRDRQRVLTFGTPAGDRTFLLDNLYQQRADRPALTVTSSNGLTTIRFNNSIGDLPTIAAFDRAMLALPRNAPITLDLTDTPSGGTTAIARAIMSWFIRRPMPYQMHQLPAEERETGVVRQWVEYVLPRAGKYHPGRVEVRVGRWTGSMGEGLAIGFMAIGKSVCGTRMSGLKGAVDDFDLPKTGLRVKFPAERLYTVGGVPRHQVVPPQCRRVRQATD
ncbi:MAG: peptidase S41 [Pseudomonadota bacterium]|jgi:carboxyl-terminal processing protease